MFLIYLYYSIKVCNQCGNNTSFLLFTELCNVNFLDFIFTFIGCNIYMIPKLIPILIIIIIINLVTCPKICH